jgi:hypothetical protein
MSKVREILTDELNLAETHMKELRQALAAIGHTVRPVEAPKPAKAAKAKRIVSEETKAKMRAAHAARKASANVAAHP